MAALDFIDVPVVNGSDDGVTLALLVNGVSVAEDTTHSDVTTDEFRIDAISVDEEGSVTVTEGTETDDQTEASAEAPSAPEGDTLIGLVTIEDAADSETMTLDLSGLGDLGAVSGDEDHVA